MVTVTITENKIMAIDVTDYKHIIARALASPDLDWSQTTLNYYKDAETPPPDLLNSTLTVKQLLQARRGDHGPKVLKIPVSIRNISTTCPPTASAYPVSHPL